MGSWFKRSDVSNCVTGVLNASFPALLRSMSHTRFQAIHGRANYEQWYNAEIVVHLFQELENSYFGRKAVCSRGEFCVPGVSRTVDWALCPSSGEKEPYAIGETKVLTVFGRDMNYLGTRLPELVTQLDSLQETDCPVFGMMFLGCWSHLAREITVQRSVTDLIVKLKEAIGDLLHLTLDPSYLQLICNPILWDDHIKGIEKLVSPNDLDELCTLQLLLRRDRGAKRWQSIQPPPQHALILELAD